MTAILCVMIEVRPGPRALQKNSPYEARASNDVGGAFACCYIRHKSAWYARLIAQCALEDLAWEIVEHCETNVASPDHEDENVRNYIHTAQLDGLCIVCHTFPPEDLESKQV